MEGFLTFILVTIAVIWLLGQVGRVVLRWWIQKKQREFAQQFGQDGNAYGRQGYGQANQRARQPKHEGEVRVQQAGKREKRVSSNVGDYVDYEEVKTEETEKE